MRKQQLHDVGYKVVATECGVLRRFLYFSRCRVAAGTDIWTPAEIS
ncbi:hypothetical protein ACIQXF_17195 [Lysinibacillus sp. NPDC097231]